jgi:DNA adenine methylase
VGGKISLLPKLREIGITEGKRFIEPFVGSGVVSLNMPHPSIIIGDTNPALIALWSQIKDNPYFVDTWAWRYFTPETNTEENFYHCRKLFNEHNLKYGSDECTLAGLFLYLNKHCFNGLCRFNSKGEFNVPYNHRVTPPTFPRKELEHAVEVSKRMTIKNCSFVDMFKLVKKDDLVFCDPPYIPAQKNGFTKYAKDDFNEDNHIELATLALEASTKGATVIICNNNVPTAQHIYRFADELHYIDVQKKINCKGDGRKKQSEIIAVYRPKLIHHYK